VLWFLRVCGQRSDHGLRDIRPTEARINGQPVIVGINAYIKPESKDSL